MELIGFSLFTISKHIHTDNLPGNIMSVMEILIESESSVDVSVTR